MMYQCAFPGCGFETDSRNLIDLHHIVPRSMKGPLKAYNEVYLCPICHRKVYVPGISAGHHSILKRDSVVCLGKLNSSRGTVVVFRMVIDGSLKACSQLSGEEHDFGDLASSYPPPYEVAGRDASGEFLCYL